MIRLRLLVRARSSSAARVGAGDTPSIIANAQLPGKGYATQIFRGHCGICFEQLQATVGFLKKSATDFRFKFRLRGFRPRLTKRHMVASKKSVGRTLNAPYLALALLGGCVYSPNTITVYDEKCQTYERHMILEVQQVAPILGCSGQECAGLLVLVGAVTVATAVVSGSVVVVGNVVYWLEKQGRCHNSTK